MSLDPKSKLYSEIKGVLEKARAQVVHTVNHTMVSAYFEIGRLIVEHEQDGDEKAGYGLQTLKALSTKLTLEFGRGFSKRNLENMRKFYLEYGKTQTVSAQFKLSWSHYVFLLSIPIQERCFYEIESSENQWSLRELKRQFNTGLFDRLRLSKDKDAVKVLSKEGQIVNSPIDIIKDPYILEFLDLKEENSYSENDLEEEIINQIEKFLLELGKGFSFVGRQVRFTFDEDHYYIDLVFYNRLLNAFVLIDLKLGKLNHQDLGQIQMYVNYYDRYVKTEDENLTIGIILAKSKKKSLVEITLPKNNTQIFASQYQTYLPTKEELLKQLDSIHQ